MTNPPVLDLLIVGGGIGGVICLKYAREAGLQVRLMERSERVGGVWRDLPSWQDIQFRREDWTLGDLPLAGEDQASILANIDAWVRRFDLGPSIELNAEVTQARHDGGVWTVRSGGGTLRSRWLIAATGGYNRPFVPQVQRRDPTLTEHHSSELFDADALRGQRVAVVGGGASAYDLLELSLVRGARRVTWIYRSTKWMRPTRRPKYFGTDMRLLARLQMLGTPMRVINLLARRDLRRRYAKAGIEDIMPTEPFDFGRHQLIPGRAEMIRGLRNIERHRAEVRTLSGSRIGLSDGASIEADLLLWGTGYEVDLGYLGLDTLTATKRLPDMAARCRSAFLSTDAPNLFLLAPGVLESNTATPWAYAHVARSMMSEIAGRQVFVARPRRTLTNHFDLVKMLAPHDRVNFGRAWRIRYLMLAWTQPWSEPMPLP